MLNRLEKNALPHAKLLAAMGNEKRFLILLRLLQGELSVGVLAEQVGLSQSALSQHLAKLRKGGLVSRRRSSQVIFYRTNNERVERIFDVLAELSATAEYRIVTPQELDGPGRLSLVLSQMREYSSE